MSSYLSYINYIRGRNHLYFPRKLYEVSIFHRKKIKRQYFSSIENFPSNIRLLKREGKAAATPFAILFIVIRQFYWSSQGQRLKEPEISDVNLFHFAEEKGFMKNLGRIPPTCSFETCFESRHFTVSALIGGQYCSLSRGKPM